MQNTDKTQDTIRKHVRGAIKAKRFQSTHAVAKRAGIPVSSLQTFMSGNQKLSEKHWENLANVFGISVQELTTGERSEHHKAVDEAYVRFKKAQNGHERLAAWQEAKASAELDEPGKGYDYTQTVEVPSKANGHTPHANVISELMLHFVTTGERRYVDAAKAILEMM